jgi:hypothetical protein
MLVVPVLGDLTVMFVELLIVAVLGETSGGD